jgi:hypothetical protein
LLGYGFVFLNSSGSILQGSLEPEVTGPVIEIPVTTPVKPRRPVFEARYKGKIIERFADLPTTIQPLKPVIQTTTAIHQPVTKVSYAPALPVERAESFIQPQYLYDVFTENSFQLLPPNLTITNLLLEHYGLKVE